ncbi:hypothetical protein [Sphingobacterium bambusae]|uniref:F5/8 type C domain-containing protein n=1 Tax=Sphingobacterium bambusae TaxID=662858 RepID=A0ABW6BG15_9SPHI|nr:hypothetical protein [Sphingobacterium bambusae]WPL50682.1 hypothetical protein SCB77_09510 [Sphingobacterium bambusae]
MRKCTYTLWYSFSILTIIFASSCKRESYPEDDVKESYTVAVRFKEFDQAIREFNTSQRAQLPRLTGATSLSSTNAVEEGYLYFWSFNQGTLEPDIYTGSGATLTYNGGLVPVSFATGWSFESYTPGFGLTITGANEIVLKIPLSGVAYVKDFGLDIGSSGTGPKSFSLSYSQNGQQYTLISDENQFNNTNTAQTKNTFVFSLLDISLDLQRDLFIKLTPKAGFRGEASDYRESTGVTKLDNIRLVGGRGTVQNTSLKTLHYHVFDALSKDLIHSGVYDFLAKSLADFSLSLPAGQYIASFVTNESSESLILPTSTIFSSFYMGNRFANHEAQIFGKLDTFTVTGHMEREIALKRYFSEIKFEFTDDIDLSHVARIEIGRTHNPEFYAPFNVTLVNPILDQSEILIVPSFSSTNKTIAFNQFLGNVLQPLAVGYRVQVYDEANTLLRSFEVNSAIPNNVQLLFRGRLLEAAGETSSFSIVLKDEWDGQHIIDF